MGTVSPRVIFGLVLGFPLYLTHNSYPVFFSLVLIGAQFTKINRELPFSYSKRLICLFHSRAATSSSTCFVAGPFSSDVFPEFLYPFSYLLCFVFPFILSFVFLSFCGPSYWRRLLFIHLKAPPVIFSLIPLTLESRPSVPFFPLNSCRKTPLDDLDGRCPLPLFYLLLPLIRLFFFLIRSCSMW